MPGHYIHGNNHDTPTPAEDRYPEPVFQAFTVKTTRGHAREKVERALKDVLGTGWQAVGYGDRGGNFEVFRKEGALTAPEAWALTYQLRAHRGIASAEPVFEAWITDRKGWDINIEGEAEGGPEFEAAIFENIFDFVCGKGNDLDKAKKNEWSLELTKVMQAWSNHFPGPDSRPGDGVVVGHPDTGYRNHPEIAGNLLANQGFDFFRDDNDPRDELQHNRPWQNPGHGTGTASVIISPRRAAAGTPPNFVSGVAPNARLIPFRVSDSVVVLNTLNLAHAIERATDAGAHVISISMGGIGSERLHDAVVYAKNRGVIVCAAAGNCVSFVVFPAAYDEVVAVAACDAERGIWKGSCRGGAVDITAPGDRVWHAMANANDALSNVGQGSGTSYAVATVAGIAALWLAKHGRDKIIQACGGKEKLPSTFMQLLRATATPVPGWPAGQFGGGLVDADKLLAAPLPDGATVPTLAPTAEEHVAINRGGGTTFAHLFDAAIRADVSGPGMLAADEAANPQDRLSDRLATLLNTTKDKLPTDLGQVGQELAFYLATDPRLYRRFAQAISPPSPAAAEAAPATPDENVEDVREGLLTKGVSPALGAKLRTRP
jgi:serine protease